MKVIVMPGLVPGIRVFLVSPDEEDVDDRDKPGHDSADVEPTSGEGIKLA